MLKKEWSPGRRGIFVAAMFLCAGIAVSITARERADFFIITDPGDYTIYNQYEQPLSSPEQRTFLSYAPLQIIERTTTLGDQITMALKFSFQQKHYYLLKNDEGAFIGKRSTRGRESLSNCQIFDDTVEVVSAGTLKMTDGSGTVFSLEKGVRCNRVFKTGARYYILALGGNPRFGWSTLEPKSAWKEAGTTAVSPESCIRDTTLPSSVKERIVEKMFAANQAYKACFAHFTTLTKEEKTVPQWNYECGASHIRCVLAGPYNNGDQLSESTRSLITELENLLIGTDFKVTFRNREILVQRRTGGK